MKRKGQSNPQFATLPWAAVLVCAIVLGLFLLIRARPGSQVSTVATNAPAGTVPAPTAAEQEQALRTEQLAAVEKLVSTFPESDDAMYLMGLARKEQGDTTGAMQSWERALSMDPTRADANDDLGYALLLRDEYQKAEEYFRKALAIDPALDSANSRLATVLVHQGKMQEAVAILEKARSLSGEGHRLLGEAYRYLGKFGAAKESYEQAVKLQPHSSEAHYGLSKVCAQLGEAANAAKHFEEFQALRTKADEAGRRLRDNYDTMAITRKSVAQTHTDVGRVYTMGKRTREAEELWLRAAALDRENTICRLQLAVLYQQTDKGNDALKYYEEIAAIDPADALVHLNIGRVCLKLNRMEQAEAAFKEVIKLAPDRPDGFGALAEIYLQTRRNLPEAIHLAETAVRLAPEAQYYALLGQAYAMNNDRAGALAAFNRAIELKPDNPQYQRLRDMLIKP